MEGDLSLLSIPDLLQMICLGGYSRDIHLFDGPVQLGVIAVRGGRVERCFGFGAWGENAFYKLVNLRRGRYRVNEAHDTTGADATLTVQSWQELLLEAARRYDEEQRVAQSVAASGRVIAFPSPTSHAVAVELPTLPPVPPVTSPMIAVSATMAQPRPVGAPPAKPPRPTRLSYTVELTGVEPSPGDPAGEATSTDAAFEHEFEQMMEEATACYLRRDLARTEELLQQCLALRPGDRRVLQNLERVRRKKPT